MAQITKMLNFYKEVKEYHDAIALTSDSPFWITMHPSEIMLGCDDPNVEVLWQDAAAMIEELALSYGFDIVSGYDVEIGKYIELHINCRG